MNNNKQESKEDEQDHSGKTDHLPLIESIKMNEEIMSKAMAESEVIKALECLEPYVTNSIYHSFSKTLYLIMISLCTFDKPDIERAAKAVEELNKCCNKYRKTGFVITLMKIIKTPNYQKYTDLESHAELIHAFSIAASAFVCALSTYNVYGLVRIAYRMQKFLKNFINCKKLFRMKTEWESDYSRLNYEAGIRLGNGLAHLAISTTPPKILRVINFLGYRGEERRAWSEINKAAFEMPGIISQLARLFLIFYWSYAEPHGLLGANNLDNLNLLLNKELEKYPESIFLSGFKAKYEQLCGRIDSAINTYKELMGKRADLGDDPFHLELMFCYGLKCEWKECINHAQFLRQSSAHTPACATYAEAVFRYVQSEDDSDEEMKLLATELFSAVPNLRIRHFGKTMTPEKVAVVNSEKFFMNNQLLVLPEVEFLYQYNLLSFIRGNSLLLNQFMQRIDNQLDRYKDDISGSDYLDNYLSALFYKGVIYKLLGQFEEAKKCLSHVLENESRIGGEFSIPPKAVMELGLTELELNNREEAEKWLNKCLNDYSGYLYENYVHLRAYGGLRVMGIASDKDNVDENKLEEYKKQWLKDIDVEDKNYEIIGTEEEVVKK